MLKRIRWRRHSSLRRFGVALFSFLMEKASAAAEILEEEPLQVETLAKAQLAEPLEEEPLLEETLAKAQVAEPLEEEPLQVETLAKAQLAWPLEEEPLRVETLAKAQLAEPLEEEPVVLGWVRIPSCRTETLEVLIRKKLPIWGQMISRVSSLISCGNSTQRR